MREYLTTQEILDVHRALVERYGGAHGVRDAGALEAAVYRPQSGYYGEIEEAAAALLESLLINHPFVDGNKRAAFAGCDVFLRINGHALNADSDWLYPRVIGWITNSEHRFERIVRDLNTCLVKM